jgi:hypothetical protein
MEYITQIGIANSLFPLVLRAIFTTTHFSIKNET